MKISIKWKVFMLIFVAILIYLCVFVLSIMFIIAYVFSYILTKKILLIRQIAHEITLLKFDKIINIPNNDELGDLATDINKISQKLHESISELQRKNIILNKNKEKAVLKAENLRKTISETDFIEIGNITCSFGVSEFNPNDTIEQMLNEVDKLLYKAKENGRNQVVSE